MTTVGALFSLALNYDKIFLLKMPYNPKANKKFNTA